MYFLENYLCKKKAQHKIIFLRQIDIIPTY
jgi:hypothetical protein